MKIIAEKRKINACAFDLGNTLINDTQLTLDALDGMANWLLERSLIESKPSFIVSYEKINYNTSRPFISHTFGEIDFFERTFNELEIYSISPEEALIKYREILLEKIRPDPEVVDTFKLLNKRGIQIALISNESVCRVEAYLKATGLKNCFDTIIVSEGVGIEKPDIRIFKEALNRLHTEANETVMFGDNDIADGACKKLGMFFVLVTGYKNKKWSWEKGNPYPPDYVMEKITPANMEAFLDAIYPL